MSYSLSIVTDKLILRIDLELQDKSIASLTQLSTNHLGIQKFLVAFMKEIN